MNARVLENKVAVITGAASGIGEAIAKTYAQQGAKILAVDINGERLQQVTQEIKDAGGEVIAVVADVVEEQPVIDFFALAMKNWGRVDLLVNSAGRDSLSPPVSETTLEEWNKTIGPNMTAVFLCCREAFRIMEKQSSGGRIINIGSSSARLASC